MQHLEHNREKRLFALLRMSLFNSCQEESLFENMSNQDWSDIYTIALSQGVLAHTYDGLCHLRESLQPDLEIKIQWAYNVNHIEKLFKHQQLVASELVTKFSEHNIKTIILKGHSLAALYTRPDHRQAGDIDVYLMGDFERANQIIKSSNIKVKYDYFVHSEFSVRGINIENHRYFVNPFVNKAGKYVEEKLLELAPQSVAHTLIDGAYTLCPEAFALFFIRHSSWHYARECISLRDICDWAMVLTQFESKINFDSFKTMLQQSGLDRYCYIITQICRQYLGVNSSLNFDDDYSELAERVKNDILTFCNPEKHTEMNFIRAFALKIRNRISRKWCYDLVVPDSYWGNIWYSIKGYITNPIAIIKAKL